MDVNSKVDKIYKKTYALVEIASEKADYKLAASLIGSSTNLEKRLSTTHKVLKAILLRLQPYIRDQGMQW